MTRFRVGDAVEFTEMKGQMRGLVASIHGSCVTMTTDDGRTCRDIPLAALSLRKLCRQCQWCEVKEGGELGTCRRFPPMDVAAQLRIDEHWCGEFEPG